MSKTMLCFPLMLILAACGGESPLAPSSLAPALGEKAEPDGGVEALNAAPSMVLRTRPVAAPGSPYPVIRGAAPFAVHFNLCDSSDPDRTSSGEGDSLNWQFHFGDDGTPPFRADGTFNPHSEHFCRADHVFERQGSYTVTVSVTDKHLEDQANDVSASARVTERLTVEVGLGGSAPPSSGPAQQAQFKPGNVPLPITDHGTTRSTLTASGVTGSIVDVDLSLHIEHTYDRDLRISLEGPDGTPVVLSNRRGSSGDDFGTSCSAQTAFDDGAATPIASGSAPFAGSYKPDSPLAAFNGKSGAAVNGSWTLVIEDLANRDTGTLVCWDMVIRTN
jgi:subtilisin-like proprotein convertase family protein